MRCPYCGTEMIDGKVQNVTMQHMTLMFKENGEEIKLKDLFKKEQKGAMVVAGSEHDAYYCGECKKLVVITDCM